MGVLTESLCFCNGVGKSEKMKATIFTANSPGMSLISGAATGFLIHRNLLLTTHANLPSVVAAESAEIQLQNVASATLFPQRFFITSSVLDLTIVGLDYNSDGDSNLPSPNPLHYLKTCQKLNLELGSTVYLLGYTDKKELTIGEGKVVIATDNLIKLSTGGCSWGAGSAGFDSQGNLAFMICDPMKLATSPNTKSCSTSSSSTSSSSKKDAGAQFGIPIPIICDWLNQHWEGSLDEPNSKPNPIIRLMSAGPRAEHSSASFTLRRVFKSTEADDDDDGETPCSSIRVQKAQEQVGTSGTASNTGNGETKNCTNPPGTRLLGIPTPEIYETPRVTSAPMRRKENSPVQLLDINFPPRFTKPAVPLRSPKLLIPHSDENSVKLPQHEPSSQGRDKEKNKEAEPVNHRTVSEISSSGSVQLVKSEVQSCASPLEASEMNPGISSEEETMYSAETAESRNYTSPREGRFQQVGRSQSCVGHGRWAPPGSSNTAARRALLEKQRSFIHGRKVQSQGANSQRSNDYYSPTVSSIMKKRNNLEHHHQHQQIRPKQTPVNSSPRWAF